VDRLKDFCDDLRAFFAEWGQLAAVIAVVLLLALVVTVAKAENATVSWTHPTQRVDNSPLPLSEIRETQVDWGLCVAGAFPGVPVGTAATPAPGTSQTIPNLTYGTWCFRARTVDTGSRLSDNSLTVNKIIIAPPKPPSLNSTVTLAYDVKFTPSGKVLLGKVVGSIALGTECIPGAIETNKGTYYEVGLDNVVLDRMPATAVVVTECAWGSA